jgi:hypothetical protein
LAENTHSAKEPVVQNDITEGKIKNEQSGISPQEKEPAKLQGEGTALKPDPKSEKKHFKEYLLEGLLIFIAVTLGFFADSLREHFAELNTTHDYLESYKLELEGHKNTIQRYDSLFSIAVKAQDSMAMLFYNKKENENMETTGRLLIAARRLFPYSFDDAAYRQLVNAGGLKYIHKPELKEAMSLYAGLIQRFVEFNQIKYADRTAYLPELNALDDLHDWHGSENIPKMDPYPTLTVKERRFIVSFYKQYYLQFYSNRRMLATLKNSNEQLTKMVKQELDK